MRLEIDAGRIELVELLAQIAARMEGKANKLIFSRNPPEINPGLMVKWNDKVMTGIQINRQTHLIQDGDTVTLLYIISGG